MTRYHLEDIGQDLLWIDIEDGDIVGAGPYHNDLYAGKLSYDYYANKTLRKGNKIRYSESPDHPVLFIKYPIVKIERLETSAAGGE